MPFGIKQLTNSRQNNFAIIAFTFVCVGYVICYINQH